LPNRAVHGLVRTVAINQIPRRLSGSKVHERGTRPHDFGVLLRPLRFSHETDEQVRFLLHVISANKIIDVSLCSCHGIVVKNQGSVHLHRERKPSVEVLERREVRLATDFQQGVGFRHYLSVVRSEEEEEEVVLWRRENEGIRVFYTPCVGFALNRLPLSPMRPPACGFRIVNSRSKADVLLAPGGNQQAQTDFTRGGHKVYSKT